MASGLQVFDAQGRVVLDTTVRTAKFLGKFSSGTTAGSVSLPELSRGSPFAFAMIQTALTTYSLTPAVTASGTTVSWSFPGGNVESVPVSATIVYGYY